MAQGAVLLVLAPSPLIAFAAVPVGVLGELAAHRSESARRITSITYDDLGGDLAARFSDIREALEGLSSSARIWRLYSKADWVVRVGHVAPAPEQLRYG